MFLPINRKEMLQRGWSALDVLLISGDAYVDHPAFGTAVIGRVLENAGYRVGIVAQPRWDTLADISRFGTPRLFVGISAGAVDSMLALRTAHRKNRKRDRYSPAGRPGLRPPRATLVYANLSRRAFPQTPVILGGLEASLRRFTHFDFWQDKIRRSFLLDAKADLLVYGMGEQAVLAIAARLAAGKTDLTHIAGTCFAASVADWQTAVAGAKDTPAAAALLPFHASAPAARPSPKRKPPTPATPRTIQLPTHQAIMKDRRQLCALVRQQQEVLHARPPVYLTQVAGDQVVIQVPPPPPENGRSLDAYYELDYTREAHPSYRDPVPALETVRWSVTAHRGCFGGCAFCAIALHQGPRIGSRTVGSLVREVRRLARTKGFAGVISDVGGPTANMYRMGCKSRARDGRCKRASCLHPTVCPHLNTDHRAWLKMLRALRAIPGVETVRVASGIRHDILPADDAVVAELLRHHIAGRLRVAPEHGDGKVLNLMRKPRAQTFAAFVSRFRKISRRLLTKSRNSNNPCNPPHNGSPPPTLEAYLITAFPGSSKAERPLLSRLLADWGICHYDVQCFTPTPGTAATAMYLAETDLRQKPLHVTKSDRARKQSTRVEMRHEKTRKRKRPKKSPR